MILKARVEDDEGYSEGKVVNTRFGSFPHSTLIGLPWGSQVRASKVDTGSRGRRGQGKDKKRKREQSDNAPNKAPKLEEEDAEEVSTPGEYNEGGEGGAVAASGGFIHIHYLLHQRTGPVHCHIEHRSFTLPITATSYIDCGLDLARI